MRHIYVFCNLGMNLLIVILFLLTSIVEKALANECGSTTSWQDGNTATITYTPNPSYARYPRTWMHSNSQNSHVVVFFSRATASRSPWYIEQFENGTYMLRIHDVTINDAGFYTVRCSGDGGQAIYSQTTELNVDITTALISVTTSSLKPSTKVSTQTTPVRLTTSQQTVNVTTPIIQTSQTSQNTETAKTSQKTETAKTSKNTETEKTSQNTETEETSQNKETEKTSQDKDTNDGALIVPVIGGVAGTVALVVVCALLLTLYHKRCKKKNMKSPSESKAKGSITAHLFGENRGAEMTLSAEEIPEYDSVIPKDQRKGAEKTVDGAEECPEYSKVVPKSERTSDAKNDLQTKPVGDTTEAANKQLIYAELDLEHPNTNTKDFERHKETERMQADLLKTGSSHENKRVAKQFEQTEYVTINFPKTEQVN